MDNIVYKNQTNYFENKKQFLGTAGADDVQSIAGIRVLGEGRVFGHITPSNLGEMIVCEENHPEDPSLRHRVVYIAVSLDSRGWIRVGEESRTNPVINDYWDATETWSDDMRWVHYENAVTNPGTWGSDVKWDGGDLWEDPRDER